MNVTDGTDTTYSNIRYSVFVEGKFIALSVVDTFVPKEFSLSQNYPNPFNPKTRIQFDIPKSSHITVVVYDLLGNKVATLIDENVMPVDIRSLGTLLMILIENYPLVSTSIRSKLKDLSIPKKCSY